jgi:hypothetical protein
MSIQIDTHAEPRREREKHKHKKLTIPYLVESNYFPGIGWENFLSNVRAEVMADVEAYIDNMIPRAVRPPFLKMQRRHESQAISAEEGEAESRINAMLIDKAAKLALTLTGRQLGAMGGAYTRMAQLVQPDDIFGDHYDLQAARVMLGNAF